MKLLKPVVAPCLLIILSACSATGSKSEFTCAGKPNGTACMSSFDVYKLTDDPELRDRVNAELGKDYEDIDDEDRPRAKDVIARVKKDLARERAGTIQDSKAISNPISQPMPVLEPAVAIRVWVAPWIDFKQDLHMPSYVYTEITPRRWSFGESVISNSRVISPMPVYSGDDDPL